MAAAAPSSPSPAPPAPFAPPALPEGLVVDLVTPLTEKGDLDEEGVRRLVARVTGAAAGIAADSPGVGEALDLSFQTRRALMAALMAAVAGRVPLFFGVTGHSLEETLELARALAAECRAQSYPGAVFMSDLPLWYHSNRGLPQTCQRLLSETGLPLVLFNLPGVISRRAPVFKRRNLRTHVFKKLVGLKGIVGLVYQGEMGRFLSYHYAAASRPSFAFYEADEINFLTRPGAWGVLSAGAQLLPGAWQRVSRACLHPEEVAADHEERLELWNLSQRLLELARTLGPNPAALLKAALAAEGVIAQGGVAPGGPAAPEPLKEQFLQLFLPLAAYEKTTNPASPGKIMEEL